MAKQNAGKILEAKIATVVALTLILHDSKLENIQTHLHHIASGQKDYFDHELAVIELAMEASLAEAMDWKALLALLREWNLNPVAVRNAPASLHGRLHALGLSLDDIAARPDTTSVAAPPAASAPPSAPTPAPSPTSATPAPGKPVAAAAASAPPAASSAAAANAPCMIVDTPVRGGQRIYARGADLVVTAIVNAGAELIADGSIHVYAPLRGRALAGAAGETGARIFALEMAPELVSIAGIYRTFEDGPPAGLDKAPAEVRLDGDRLDLRAIGARSK